MKIEAHCNSHLDESESHAHLTELVKDFHKTVGHLPYEGTRFDIGDMTDGYLVASIVVDEESILVVFLSDADYYSPDRIYKE